MAWVAADRMARSVAEFGLPGPGPRWADLREQIHQDVLANGFDAERNTFTQAYGSRRAGRQPAADPPGGLPAGYRPAGAGHDRPPSGVS